MQMSEDEEVLPKVGEDMAPSATRTETSSSFLTRAMSSQWSRLAHKQTLRQLSFIIKKDILAPVGSSYPRSTALLYTMNMVLGTGPLTLPYAYTQGGFLESTLFLGFCAFLNYVTVTYAIEALALGNAMMYQSAEHELLEEDRDHYVDSFKVINANKEYSSKVYKIRERIELGEMGQRVMPKPLPGLLYMTLFLHMFGTLCVYAVSLTKSVSLLVAETAPGLGSAQSLHPPVAALLPLALFPLCFADLQRLKSMQFVVIVIRVVMLVGMLSMSVWIIWNNKPGSIPPVPEVQPAGLSCLYANAVLCFMTHHSIPGLIAPLEHQSDAPRVFQQSTGISYLIYVFMGFTALQAFGPNVKALYSENFVSIPYVGLAICAYPLLMLGVYPIVAITLRNNLINALGLPPPSDETRWAPSTIMFTSIVVLLPCAVAAVTDDVQAVVSVFAGYFGLSIMLFWSPLLLMFNKKAVKNRPGLPPLAQTRLASPVGSPPALVAVLVIWAAGIIFNTHRLFFA